MASPLLRPSMEFGKCGYRGMTGVVTALSAVLLSFVIAAPGVSSSSVGPSVLGTTYGGRAFGVGVLTLLGDTYYADTGNLPSSGGALFAPFTYVGVDLVDALVWSSYARGFGDLALGEPAVSDLTLLPGDVLEVGASFVYARSAADCDEVSGWSEVFDLTVGGVPYGVSGAPNQVIYSVPGVFTLVANEQIDDSFGTTNALTVNALHLWTPAVEVIVASVTSQVTCSGLGFGFLSSRSTGTRSVDAGTLSSSGGLPTPMHVPSHDFMTGGGWFEPATPYGRPGRVNFGFNAGPRPGSYPVLKGNVNLIDHSTGDHVQGRDVTDYFPFGDPQDVCRVFAGHAKVNGVPGYNYRVVACDYGEPGRDDRFAIEVRSGTATTGDPVYYADNGRFDCPANEPYCGDLDGGNIQLHRYNA